VKDGENQRRVLKDWMTEPGSQRFWMGRFEWDFHQNHDLKGKNGTSSPLEPNWEFKQPG